MSNFESWTKLTHVYVNSVSAKSLVSVDYSDAKIVASIRLDHGAYSGYDSGMCDFCTLQCMCNVVMSETVQNTSFNDLE